MTLVDYSDIEKQIKDAPEPKILPRGAKAELRIIAVRSGNSEKPEYNGAQWFQPVFDVPSDPMVMEFNDFFWDLADKDKIGPKQTARTMNRFKTFATAFGLNYSKPFNWANDLPGKKGWAILGIKKSDEYGEQNTVSKYVARK